MCDFLCTYSDRNSIFLVAVKLNVPMLKGNINDDVNLYLSYAS